METTLNDIPMMYIAAEGGPAGARDAFNKLEGKLPSLKGRKFYGTFQPETGEYRACVAIESGDDPNRMGLATGVIPGGLYFREKLKNWMSRIDEIGKTFLAIAERERHRVDKNRPSVEFYRSQDELILLLPIQPKAQ
jgi:hypothetical protein